MDVLRLFTWNQFLNQFLFLTLFLIFFSCRRKHAAISLLTSFFAEQKNRTKQKARDRERERVRERKKEREMNEPDYYLEYLDKH